MPYSLDYPLLKQLFQEIVDPSRMLILQIAKTNIQHYGGYQIRFFSK